MIFCRYKVCQQFRTERPESPITRENTRFNAIGQMVLNAMREQHDNLFCLSALK